MNLCPSGRRSGAHWRNPNALVPTLEDEGFVLWESNAIVRYLCTKHSEHGLYPQDLRARFDPERWMDWWGLPPQHPEHSRLRRWYEGLRHLPAACGALDVPRS